MYKNWINGLLGLVIVAVLFMNLSETALTWTLGIVGALIALNSFWAMLTDDTQRGHSMQRRA